MSAGAPRRRVLAAEDTSSLRALLQLCLVRAGYDTQIVEDGQEAVDYFVAGRYDAVVLDIQMPVLDGLGAAARIRAWEKENGRAPVPILALTANAEPADLKRCVDAGCTTALRKPFAREELLSALSELLRDAPAPEPAPAQAAARPESDAITVKAEKEYADLIPHFLDSCRKESAAMRAAAERGDFKAVAAAGHKLVGAGASFGFEPLSVEGRALETAARAGDAAAVRRHLDTMNAYLAKVKVVYA